MNVELSLKLPDTIQVSKKDVEMIMIYALFEKGILTSGQAAEIVGLSKKTFLENAAQYGVSLFQYDENELSEEVSQWQ